VQALVLLKAADGRVEIRVGYGRQSFGGGRRAIVDDVLALSTLQD
jgi:hypothetical protein